MYQGPERRGSYQGAERRGLRSDFIEVALQLFLDRRRMRMGLKSLVVADARGEPLGYSGDCMEPHFAAAHTAALYHDGTPLPGLGAADPHFAWQVEYDGQEAYVFAWGSPFGLSAEVEETSRGIARICSL